MKPVEGLSVGTQIGKFKRIVTISYSNESILDKIFRVETENRL